MRQEEPERGREPLPALTPDPLRGNSLQVPGILGEMVNCPRKEKKEWFLDLVRALSQKEALMAIASCNR